MTMKRLLAITAAAAVALAVSLAPAAAKSKKYRYQAEQDYYDEPYQQQGWNGGWTGRTVSDPSFGNRTGINRARSYGRCVVDLGYGRFEYCGW
jgi:uncharacterized membrane protein